MEEHCNYAHLHKKPYKCALCPQKLELASYFARHRIQHNSNPQFDHLFSCSQCKRNFIKHSTLRKHIDQNHRDEKLRAKCDICDEFMS